MAVIWYDRKGRKIVNEKMVIGSKEWFRAYQKIEKLLTDYNYKVVKRTRLWWGGRVSTVWLGIDHGYEFLAKKGEKYKPLIFETMVFPLTGYRDLDCVRYSTEEEAKRGHWKTYWKWSNPITLIKLLLRKEV